MKNKRPRSIFLLLFLFLIILWGCDTIIPPVNQPPAITSAPVTVATVDVPYVYNVEASDPNGDTLTYSLIVHPGGMDIDPASGLISWTPVAGQGMDTQVEIMVSDGKLETFQSFVITFSGVPSIVLLSAISVLPETMVLCVDESRSITSIIASYSSIPDASIPLQDADYSSSNPNKVIVSSQGVITGVQLGSATITVSYPQEGGVLTKTDTINVTVSPVRNITQDIGYNTIQASLNAANNNDTIKVSSGTYYESITFPLGKVIVLESINGAASTFIKGDDGKPTITCYGSQKGTDIRGFTITHQIGNNGSGVYNGSGWIKLTNCKIEFNSSAQSGGGIWNHGATLDLFGSTINGNSADYRGGGIFNEGTLNVNGKSVISNNEADYGGGICNDHGTTILIDETRIVNNNAFSLGGGYYHDGGTSTITGNSIISQNVAIYGGGISQNGGTLNVTGGSIVSENEAQDGGGIYSYSGTLNVNGITVSENYAGNMTGSAGWAGGIRIYQSKATITKSTISKNTADYGGGIWIGDGDVTIAANTISENSARENGGGIYITNISPLIPYVIGAINIADKNSFNHFTDNKKGNTVSSGQHIRSSAGDMHGSYPNNYYSPD